MRVARLVALAVVCYLIALVVLFPAKPVIDRLRPQLGPVALDGVSGPLWKGTVASVRSTDDLLPLEFENVGWRLSPTALVQGGGARITFDGYGGGGEGLVTRHWNQDIEVSDLEVEVRAKALEPLLPVPLAEFDGALTADIDSLLLRNELLERLTGTLRWSEATLQRPFEARFGTVELTVAPDGGERHAGTVSIDGGDVSGGGEFTIAPNGDFTVDVSLTPSASAPPAIVDGLRRVARPDADGRYRLQQSGNVNRLM